MSVLPRAAEAAIRELTERLAAREYAKVLGSIGVHRVSVTEMEQTVRAYGRTLLPLPADAFDFVDAVPLDATPNAWAVDIPLWTREEGRSDLTLSLSVMLAEVDGSVTVHVDDLHVP